MARPRSGVTELRGAVAAVSGFLASAFLLGVAFGATGNYIALQIDFLGGGAIVIGAAAAFQAFTEVPTMAYMHVLVARFGTRRLYALGCAIYLGVFVSWAFVTSPMWIALLRLVCGVGFGFIAVAAVVITDELTPAHLRAAGQALVKSTMFGLAPIVGTLGGGLVYSALYVKDGWFGQFLVPLGIEGAYSRLGIVLVLVFTGLPFVVRTLQPVLENLDRGVEEAAATLGAGRLRTFLRVIAPTIFPTIITGFALSFARAVGEYGSIVFISGNKIFQTEIAPFIIVIRLDEYDYLGATAIAAVLLVVSFIILAMINYLEVWSRRFHST